MDNVIAAFIRGRVVIAAIQSVTFTVGYLLAGVPAAFILGPFTGIVSIVPYAALVSLPVAALLLYVEPNYIQWQDLWWWNIVGPVVVYFPLQALDDYVLTPLIQGKETDMETPAILFASIAGAMYGMFQHGMYVENAFWLQSAQVLIMTLLGGIYSFFGPLIGAAVLFMLERLTNEYTSYWPTVLGVVLLVILLLLPDGLAGLSKRLLGGKAKETGS